MIVFTNYNSLKQDGYHMDIKLFVIQNNLKQ